MATGIARRDLRQFFLESSSRRTAPNFRLPFLKPSTRRWKVQCENTGCTEAFYAISSGEAPKQLPCQWIFLRPAVFSGATFDSHSGSAASQKETELARTNSRLFSVFRKGGEMRWRNCPWRTSARGPLHTAQYSLLSVSCDPYLPLAFHVVCAAAGASGKRKK